MDTQVLNQQLEILNGSDRAARVVVEPWADEQILSPGETCRVAYKTAPGHEVIEFEYVEGGIIIHFPTGSVADFVE